MDKVIFEAASVSLFDRRVGKVAGKECSIRIAMKVINDYLLWVSWWLEREYLEWR